jgi:hypothetical protein
MQMATATTYNADGYIHTPKMQMVTATKLYYGWLQLHTKNADGYTHTLRMQMAKAKHLECR